MISIEGGCLGGQWVLSAELFYTEVQDRVSLNTPVCGLHVGVGQSSSEVNLDSITGGNDPGRRSPMGLKGLIKPSH
jgi:hypothetical protein